MALESTVEHATGGGAHATFDVFHLVIGGAASFILTGIVRDTGISGVLLGTLHVAGPAIFAACYGLLLFEELNGNPTK